MTLRDMMWRAGGLALFGTACAFGFGNRLSDNSAADTGNAVPGLLSFGLAIMGIVLLVHGKRVALAWRVERSRHRNLAATIHARRQRRAVRRDRTTIES